MLLKKLLEKMDEIEIKKLESVNEKTYGEIKKLLLQLYPKKEPISFSEFKIILTNNNLVVYVASDRENIIGMASLFHYRKLGGKVAVIEDVVVAEGYRGKGIGSKLTKYLLKFAKENNYGFVDVNTRRESAKDFYIKKGFDEKNKDRVFYALRYHIR